MRPKAARRLFSIGAGFRHPPRAALSQKLRKMTAACARVVVPAGLRVVGLVPLMSPTDRAHRIGQTRKVVVYRLIAKGTIEERIQQLQENKKALSDQIIQGDVGQLGVMSREDFLQLLM